MEPIKKLIAIDLDGTLLNRHKKITKKSMQSLKQYAQMGGEIVIITGKNISNGMKYVREIENQIGIQLKYASFLSGSIVYDIAKQEIVACHKFSEAETKIIYDAAVESRISFLAINHSGDKEIYYMKHKRWFNTFMKLVLIHKNPSFILTDYYPFECYKFDVWGSVLKSLDNFIEKMQSHDTFHLAKINHFFLEMTLKSANKGFALTHIAELLKIPLDQTAAIGDSSNDISMLKVAGLSFGIGRKKNKDFQAASKIKIKRSKRNPVAYAINHYLLDNNQA